MKANHPSTAQDYFAQVGHIRPGNRSNLVLLTGTEGAPDNYRVAFSEGIEGQEWSTPRHHHNFEQIRFILQGEYQVTKTEKISEGSIGYVSAGVHYGPQIQSSGMKMLLLQFGGMSREGYISVRQRKESRERLLAKGGTFENGIYSRLEPDGTRYQADAFEAIWEETTGAEIAYPRPRYDNIVIMHPDNFGWVPVASSPGTWRKWLGTFTEGDIKIGFIRMSAGAELLFGEEPSVEVLYVSQGALTCPADDSGNATFKRQTALATTADDSPEILVATEDAELFYVKLPTFGPASTPLYQG
ncbi:MAG TPA: hypothetical protein VGG83_03630 [Trebonia sp.]|jgi:mannose-6-phosphate isomerase-like protein (cupin superfamily)